MRGKKNGLCGTSYNRGIKVTYLTIGTLLKQLIIFAQVQG